MKISGKIIDVSRKEIYEGEICITGERINEIRKKNDVDDVYIMPGLIDAHIHIESSMLTPGAFASAAVSRGTIGAVSDPHEIANILGIEGIDFMISDGKRTPFKFYFGAPSCVPATVFETAGAKLGPEEIRELLMRDEIKYLAEVMNFPGVINENKDVLDKIEIAIKLNKPVDGHAPGITGNPLKKYIASGITTDHECNSLDEALEKISLGMKIIIREGSAGRNLNALKDLYRMHPDMIMLCSDDIHPEMLRKRHLDKLIAGLINEGYDLFSVLRSATLNSVLHYKLDAGLLRPGDYADFIIVDNPSEMKVLETWINGKKVYDKGKVLFEYKPLNTINKFHCSQINKDELSVKNTGSEIRVITAFDGDLFTKEILQDSGNGKFVESDTSEDTLKIVVKDRYRDYAPAVAFIRGFGLKSGAFAGSVSHDSHNIIAIGVKDEDIVNAVNEIIRLKGGLSVVCGNEIHSLQLSVAGIMSDRSCSEVAENYEYLSEKVKKLGCKMSAPFMTLSFMALLVIPELKLSDKGLFDGKSFSFVPLFSE